MADIEVYSAWWCPSSLKAKNLLETKHLSYRETDVTKVEGAYETMVGLCGRSTTPQIVIDGAPIGGYDDLVRLASSGELDRLLRDELDP